MWLPEPEPGSWCGLSSTDDPPGPDSLDKEVLEEARVHSAAYVLWSGRGGVRMTRRGIQQQANTSENQPLPLIAEDRSLALLRVGVRVSWPHGSRYDGVLALYVEPASLVPVTRRDLRFGCSPPDAGGSQPGVEIAAGTPARDARVALGRHLERSAFIGAPPNDAIGCVHERRRLVEDGNQKVTGVTSLAATPRGARCARVSLADGVLTAHEIRKEAGQSLVAVPLEGGQTTLVGWVSSWSLRFRSRTPFHFGGIFGSCPIVANFLDDEGGATIGLARACDPDEIPASLRAKGSGYVVVDTTLGPIEAWAELVRDWEGVIQHERANGFSNDEPEHEGAPTD